MGVVAAQGSGTGLSLVASIAELHQARIDTDTGIDSAGLPYVCCFQWPETGMVAAIARRGGDRQSP